MLALTLATRAWTFGNPVNGLDEQFYLTIGERLLERVSDDARHALDRTLDVAAESKGIAAATAALLALWFLRGPILELVGGLWEANFGADEEFDEADVTD